MWHLGIKRLMVLSKKRRGRLRKAAGRIATSYLLLPNTGKFWVLRERTNEPPQRDNLHLHVSGQNVSLQQETLDDDLPREQGYQQFPPFKAHMQALVLAQAPPLQVATNDSTFLASPVHHQSSSSPVHFSQWVGWAKVNLEWGRNQIMVLTFQPFESKHAFSHTCPQDGGQHRYCHHHSLPYGLGSAPLCGISFPFRQDLPTLPRVKHRA